MFIERCRGLESAIGVGLVLAASVAHAGNGTKPRVVVDWTGTPCMTVVDRSADPMLHIAYLVEQDDVDLTEDEVDDSRTHQFFAFCRANDLQTFLPRWITQADIDRAAAKGSAPDDIDPEDVFETSTVWAGCWSRVNADDDRRPITMAAAAEGVDWDTSALAPGTYTLQGYTFEPPFNVWSASPGVVKVVDDPDPAASGPAIAIENPEEVIYQNQTVTIGGCVSAMEGSTLTASWAKVEPDPQWTSFIEDDPIAGTSFEVDLTPPETLSGESAMIRVDVTDPLGRGHTNYMRKFVIVLDTDGPSGCADESGSFIGEAGCADSGEGTAGGASTTEAGDTSDEMTASDSTSGPPAQDEGSAEGCACRSATGRAPTGVALWLLLGTFGLCRTRSRRH